jgi:hypothetical protein
MDNSKISIFLGINADKFNPVDLNIIQEKLQKLDDDKLYMLSSVEYRKPSNVLLLAIFTGWERFWLDDVGIGVLKIITCYGCGIWWLIDIFTAKSRAMKYNFKKFQQATAFC